MPPLLPLLLLLLAPSGVAIPPALDLGSDAVVSRLRHDVEYLASDALGGRDTGSPHVRLAEEHVAAAFRAAGLQPLPGQESFFVPFELERDGFDRDCTRVTVTAGGRAHELLPEADFRPFDFSDEGRRELDVVFAGYGITAPEHGWDDYAGLDVAGKAVLVLRHEPREDDPRSPFDGAESTQHATFREKAANASRHGAAALVVVTDPLHHEPGEDLRWGGALRLPAGGDAARPRRGSRGGGGSEPATEGEPLLAIHVSRAVAERLVAASGTTLAAAQLMVDDGLPWPSRGASLGRIDVAVSRASTPERVAARDVAGVLPGSDPAVADQWIVVGGHHDHVGMFDGPGDTVFNGADDNASGTSAVMELVRRFASSPDRPRRTLVFVTFSGEEKGLLGSRYLVDSGLLPMSKVAFMLNNDMLGRNPGRPVEAVGDGFATGMRAVVEKASEGLGLSLQYAGDGYFGASDHDPFHQRDVPFLFFFTGTHEDYHQVGDHADKIEFGRMAKLVELEDRLVRAIADAPEAPQFVHHVLWLGAKAEAVRGDDGRRRAVLTSVEAGSRGDKAGLRPGDVLAALDGKDLADPSKVGQAFRDVAPGTSATLSVIRDLERKDIAVARPKPGLLGVQPGSLEADELKKLGLRDDEGLVLRAVTPDGPAAKAGLQAGDILVRLGGQPVNQRQLSSRLAQIGAGETTTAVVLRDGVRIEATVTLGERR